MFPDCNVFYYSIHTYNYPDYIARGWRPDAHFPSEHELRVKDSTTSCCHNMLRVWVQTLCLLLWPLFAFQTRCKLAGSWKKTRTMVSLSFCYKGNITCGWYVAAPFQRNCAAAARFCCNATTRSCMEILPFPVLATRSLLGSSASRFLTIAGCCHSELLH